MSIVKSFSFPKGEIRGNMFYIKHNSGNFTVIDCYLKEGDGKDCRQDEIINEIIYESSGRVCRFISTHPDKDHILGIDELDRRWKIENFYAVANDIPFDPNDKSRSAYIRLKKEKNFPIKRGITREWLNMTNSENGSSELFFQWPDITNGAFQSELEKVKKGGSPNGISCILTYLPEEGPTYMWMGDLETSMQQEYYDCCRNYIPHVDILFHPHHGRESGAIPDDLLKALDPKIIVIGNAPAEHLDYGDSDLTITQNTAGDIIFENDGSEVYVYSQNKVDNIPAALKKKPRKDIYDKWYYMGTLDVDSVSGGANSSPLRTNFKIGV